MTTVAAIDCGTNSIRLLVLRREADGALRELAREVRLARLGQGVDAAHAFHPDALARSFAIFEEFARIIAQHGADRVRFVATSAARDVTNRDELAEGVRLRLGVELDVISGDEEARLSTAGVMSGVGVATPALIFDIGGGSTELVVVEHGREPSFAESLDMGAVRVRERFLHSDPPTEAEVAQARVFVAGMLAGAAVDFSVLETSIGVAGTVTSVAARVLGLSSYARESVHRTRLSRDEIASVVQHWLTTPVAQIEQEPCMHPLRAGVIGGGALILDEIARRIPGGGVLVSETDILDGIALGLLNGEVGPTPVG